MVASRETNITDTPAIVTLPQVPEGGSFYMITIQV